MSRTVFEVGVNLGQHTEKLIPTEPGSRYYGFEPTYDLLFSLVEKFRNHKNAVFVPMAVDVENKVANFNIATYHDWGCSSLHEFSDNIHSEWPDNPAFFGKSQNVMTIRLDTFCDTFGINGIDSIWIDAQGNDFNVLKSMGKYIDSVKLGQLEVSHNVKLYKGVDNSYENVTAWLKERGFRYETEFDATPQKAEANIIFYR